MEHAADAPRYRDPSLSPTERAADLIAQMTVPEKVSQMVHDAFAIPRLGVPAYNWWNECLHGVGRAGIATVFPQAIGLAATFNEDLMFAIATAISDEARAKHHASLSPDGGSMWYYGLTYWSPNINIFRDPRWGRGQETYGEDPYLTARMGVAFVQGLQGDDPKYLKVIATPKHYAVHSGPEKDRHGFDARVSQRDLRETYLAAFKATVQEAGAMSVMSAYNRTNGEVCSGSKILLQDILRDEWGFAGYVVSDCGAIDDVFTHHGAADSAEGAAALCVNNGCDLNCGCTYMALGKAIAEGLITSEAVDLALQRLFEARFRLGMFDPPELVPYAQTPIEVNDCAAHRELALQAARESIVLLKNDGILPLASSVRAIAVIGPNADEVEPLLGNYNGTPSRAVTPVAGIRARAGEAVAVTHVRGCELVGDSREGFAEAIAAAERADVVIVQLGLSAQLEGEEGEEGLLDPSGDRRDLGLPGIQEDLLREVAAVGKPTILVLQSGSALAVNWAAENVAAILSTWYGGEEAGTALAEVLFGDYNPAGRLPVTFYQGLEQVPPFEDYSMAGRTYRFMEAAPLYGFGFGLSYTKFAYSALEIASPGLGDGTMVEIAATVTNVGECAGDEVVQLYLTDCEATVPVPLRQLQGFRRVHLQPGQSTQVAFTLTAAQMACYTDEGKAVVEPGWFELSVGGAQPQDGEGVQGSFEVVGEVMEVE